MSVLDRDLAFIGEKYLDVDLPKEKRYLLKYFDTRIQEAFVKYVHVFGDYENFVDHTGLRCKKQYLQTLHERLQKLEALHRQAKSSMDLETLAEIEMGNYKI